MTEPSPLQHALAAAIHSDSCRCGGDLCHDAYLAAARVVELVLSDPDHEGEIFSIVATGPHLVKLDLDGWTIQHPGGCRPNLFACPFNRAAQEQRAWIPGRCRNGIFELEMDDDGNLVVGDRVRG